MATSYTVKAGDTLSAIAQKYGTSVSAIASANGVADANKIGVGQVFNIPSAAAAPVSTVNAGSLGTPAAKTTYTAPPTTTPIQTATTAGVLGLAQQTQDRITALQPTVDQGKTDIQTTLTDLSSEEEKRQSLYDSSGVNQAQQDLTDINNQMSATKKKYDDQIAAVTANNPTGQLDSGQQIQVDDLQRKQSSELADLAIVAEAKQGNYTTAKSIVDAKIDAETSDLKTKLQGLQFFYQENESDLSDAQKTLLQQETDQVQNDYNDKKQTLSDVGDIQLTAAKNGAPASVVQKIGQSQTRDDAIASAGSYLKTPSTASTFFSDTDQRTIAQSGLKDSSAQLTFVHTPAAFQDAFIANGTGFQYPNATSQNILTSLAEWEKQQADAKTNGDVDALISALNNGGS